MSTKYHFSTRTHKVGVCGATKRACQFGQHFSTAAEAASQVASTALTPATIEGITKPPIVLSPSPYTEPDSRAYLSYDYDYDYYGEMEDYYGLGYDYYSDEPSYGDSYSVYDNLHLTSIDAEQSIKTIFNVPADHELPEDIHKMIQDNGWNDKYNWSIHAEPDYYGETAVVTPPSDMFPKLTEWYWSQDNAVDKDGILHYVRSKGTETKGCSPLDAIKKQLAEENEGRSNRLVENANNIKVSNLSLNRLSIPHASRLDRVEPRAPKDYENKAGIAGIIVRTRDAYRLVDGYHRLKDLKNANKYKGKYIVLS